MQKKADVEEVKSLFPLIWGLIWKQQEAQLKALSF